MDQQELFNLINKTKSQLQDNREMRHEHHIIIQDLDNEYFKLTAILIDLLKQLNQDDPYKF